MRMKDIALALSCVSSKNLSFKSIDIADQKVSRIGTDLNRRLR